jgi:FkbM family methyltransferase
VWFAVKTRNQCNAIIGRALGATVIDHRMNGEEKLAAALGGQLRYFVDVGANRGSWTAMFLRHQPVVAGGLLFEPSVSAINELLPRFAGTPQLEVIAAAAGDAAGEISFYEEASAGETSSVVANHSAMPAVKRTVPVTTVSAEVSARNWAEVDFLKIDADGYDFHVLRGAQELFAAQKVRIGQFEYLFSADAGGAHTSEI